MRKIKLTAGIVALAIGVAIWIGCAWIVFSPDETWTQYRLDCVLFLFVSGFIAAMIATVPL